MFKAIIFDFDGVLVLSDEPQFKVIQQMAKKYNITIAYSDMRKMVGKTTITFLSNLLKKEEKPLLDKIIFDYEKEFKENIVKHVPPLDFSVDFIKNYSGSLQFALASVSGRKVIEDLTKHFGIYSKFRVIITKEDVTKHKPDPEVYIKAAERLGILPEKCAVVEDSILGATAAIRASMKCYILLNGSNTKEEFAQLPIAGFISSEKELYKIN